MGELKIFMEPPRDEVELRHRIDDAEIIVVGWTHLGKDLINSASKLKMISIWATTCHYADLEAARNKGITVTHVPGYATEAVAEHTFALLLAVSRKLTLANQHVKTGRFDWRPFEGKELAEKTIGVIGTGAIGFRVAEIARVFKMNVIGYDKYPKQERAMEIGFKYVDFPTLLRQSDVITNHVTLTQETERLIGRKEIDMMKAGVIVINTSQGKVIDESALVEALRSGKIAAAGLDVLEQEPPNPDNPLFELENVVLSPHIGFNTSEAATRCTDICIDNVAKFLEGEKQNVC